MKLNATAGAKILVGTSAEAETLQEFEGDTYTEIKGVEDLGDFGDTRTDLSINLVNEWRIRHQKGAKDGGVISLVCARVATDPGQIILRQEAAADNTEDRNYRVTLADAPAGGTPSEYFFRGVVLDSRTALGQADNIIRTTFRIAINSDTLEVAAAPPPPP